MRRVKEVLIDTGLEKCQHTPIGLPGLLKEAFESWREREHKITFRASAVANVNAYPLRQKF